MDMQVSPTAVELVKQFEGLRLVAYIDAAGIWTIGYGHTDGVGTGQGKITEVQANAWLQDDLRRAGARVSQLVTWPINQNQFDALVSFVFNVGPTAFAGSTLLRKLNGGDMEGAASEFERWRYAGGRVLPGLLRRRIAERTLFTKPV